ncbi:hatching enzyme 1.2-like isoform X3 [Aphidius gifuensis]|nr:hatching enzyme 1.2-like isoform X3 [Aphidius gifuensis]
MIVKLFSFFWILMNVVDTFPRKKYNFNVPCEVKRTVLNPMAYSMVHLDWLMNSRQDPEVRPGLYQGDIAMTNEDYNYLRVGLRWDVFSNRMWKNRIVPYVISPLYRAPEYIKILKTLIYLKSMTCINFVPRDKFARDYIIFEPTHNPDGCWSYIGKIGGAQLVSLEPPDNIKQNCFNGQGFIIHEVLHALGIFHEQSRADRDNFVNIHYENIIPGELVNFRKESLENTTYSYEYDYHSIMHYGSFSFSIDRLRKPTITSKIPGITVGQRENMTKTDCLKVNKLYGCLDDPSEAKKWNAICSTLEI